MHPELKQVIEEVAKTRWAALICDPDWRIAWVSDEMKVLLDEHDETKLGYGEHVARAWLNDVWRPAITAESQAEMMRDHLPYLLERHSKEELRDILGEEFLPFLEGLEPKRVPPVHMDQIEYVQQGFDPVTVRSLAFNVVASDGSPLCMVELFGSALPARLLALVARGDEAMFSRMANLVEPGPRSAAILFADLQESSVLSRRLPSAIYFRLVAEITQAMDKVVIDHQGIVGKHAGDGTTAFFLADDCGSDSAAARAAIEAAREIGVCASNTAKQIGDETGLLEASDTCVNVGVHWGGRLFMGQLLTGGRLEITALGDQVNEAARIQQSARDGQILISKNVVEHLDPKDASELDLEPSHVIYRTIAEIDHVSEKALRDAGTIPVTTIGR